MNRGSSFYWFAHNNNTFHVVALDGTERSNVILIAPGRRAYLMYPHLTLADKGTLFAAWTTQRPTTSSPQGYLYHSVHAIKSPDGGQTWQTLDGRRLEVPIIADDSGPVTQISKDSEFDVHKWLSAFMAKAGKLHFAYWAETKPQRQWYLRYDVVTGKAEIETETIFADRKQEKPNDSGALRPAGPCPTPRSISFPRSMIANVSPVWPRMTTGALGTSAPFRTGCSRTAFIRLAPRAN